MAANTPVFPCFDLELFLRTAGETRLDGAAMDACLTLWEEWRASLACWTVKVGDRGYLAVWLEEDVETVVDAAWKKSPFHGCLLIALAQTLCMCAAHECVPEIEDAGCAPVPAPSEELAAALTGAGLPARSGNGLELGRRYAVVTRQPFGGACEICALRSSCPRSGRSSDSMVEIG